MAGNLEKSFYSVPEFEEWQKATADWHTWKVKYYKGLGTSTRSRWRVPLTPVVLVCVATARTPLPFTTSLLGSAGRVTPVGSAGGAHAALIVAEKGPVEGGVKKTWRFAV